MRKTVSLEKLLRQEETSVIYMLTKILVYLYFNLYHRLAIYDKDNIPKDRNVILASNHASYLDPPAVGLAFDPRRLKFVAWEKLFSFPLFGAYLRKMGTVPVSPDNKGSSAGLLRMVMGFLQEGSNVYICPEGHRTETGDLQPLEGGVAILSTKTGTPVVPVWVGGTFRAFAPHMKFPRPRKVTVSFGEPIDPNSFPEDMPDREKRRKILEGIEAYYKKMDRKDREKYPR
jgi:1-acyl-sn-glycerol-3-phosphate acyltransferase